MGNHPLFSQQAQHPGSMPKALCRIPTECESIPDHCQEKEIGIHFPTLDREERGGEKHHGVGPQIALSPTWMTPRRLGMLNAMMPVMPVASPAHACTTSGRKK